MGVNHLWSILSPVKKHKSLQSLQGQTLAVDLSIWICESQAVKQMKGNVIKPFLRNLFFRVNHLLQLGINLIFVIDGCPPKIKGDTIRKRLNHVQNGNIGDWKKQPNRGHFNIFLRECCCLLDSLGIPYLESFGEAESYCAFLNANGIVDACLTDDGDAFLYGAKEIYRNFTMDSKDPHVESYKIKDIENQLKFNRNHLVAFALLVGCDYLPKGVPKIGVETTLKLFKTLGDKDVLARFKEWRLMKPCEFSNPVEANVRKKALSLPEFPHAEVIKEFLLPKDKLPEKDLNWKRPNVTKFQEIAVQKLEWAKEYALKKMIPLITKWTMLEIVSGVPAKHFEEDILPDKILKTRIRQGVPCFEVQWKISGTTDENADDCINIEEQEIFRKCYPCFVEQFSQLQISQSQTKNKGSKKKKENPQTVDDLLLDMEKLSLLPPSDEKSCGKESVHSNENSQTEKTKIQQKGKKSALSCQSLSSSSSSSSSTDQQIQKSITSAENDGIFLPVELKTDFLNCNFPSPGFDDKYCFPSQKKQQKEFSHSPNVTMSPLPDLLTRICQNRLDESNDENLFSPVFQKLQCQHLLSENNSETIISNEKLFSCSEDGKLRNKQILNSLKVSSQSTPKILKSLNDADDKTHQYPEFHVFSQSTKHSNTQNENLCGDDFFLQATQKETDVQSFNNTLPPEIFHDVQTQKDCSSFSKNDSTQLTSNNSFNHSVSKRNENFNDISDNLAFVNVDEQENYDVTLSSFNHDQFIQEPSILFINDTTSSEIDDNSINNVQCNYNSFLSTETELTQNKTKDSSQLAKESNEIHKTDCKFEIKPNLLEDSQKLTYENDKNLPDHYENPEHFLNLSVDDKNVNSIINISGFSNDSFNEHKSLLGLSTISNNDSKLISSNLHDQDSLPYSSFENDPSTINAVENALDYTPLYSFEKSDLGQFDLLATFLNDSSDNQNKH